MSDAPERHAGMAATTRLECQICWTVYDPAVGDEVWQIPPGTPFADLPPHWTCPNCSALKHQFLILDEEHAGALAAIRRP